MLHCWKSHALAQIIPRSPLGPAGSPGTYRSPDPAGPAGSDDRAGPGRHAKYVHNKSNGQHDTL